MQNLPKIIIVDDHLIFQQGLKAVIITEKIADVIGVAANGNDLVDLLSGCKPDIILMDIDMPFMDGMEATRKALEMYPDVKVITLTMFSDEEYYYKMIELGVKGFILKSTGISELEKAINDVMLGESYFSNELLRKIISNFRNKSSDEQQASKLITPREQDVLKEICAGSTTDEIAKKLNISSKTVKSHRSSILEKTNSKNTASLILFAIKNKLVEL